MAIEHYPSGGVSQAQPQPQSALEQQFVQDRREDEPLPGGAAPALTKQEMAGMMSRALQDMKEHMVKYGLAQQWEVDHLFEGALKHLSSV